MNSRCDEETFLLNFCAVLLIMITNFLDNDYNNSKLLLAVKQRYYLCIEL